MRRGKPPFIDRHMEATDHVTINIRRWNNGIVFVCSVSRQTNLFLTRTTRTLSKITWAENHIIAERFWCFTPLDLFLSFWNLPCRRQDWVVIPDQLAHCSLSCNLSLNHSRRDNECMEINTCERLKLTIPANHKHVWRVSPELVPVWFVFVWVKSDGEISACLILVLVPIPALVRPQPGPKNLLLPAVQSTLLKLPVQQSSSNKDHWLHS